MSDAEQFLVRDGARQAQPDGEIDGEGWSIAWQTLRGGLSDGVELITLSNGTTRVTICPTRGMGVLNASVDGVHVGWQSPVAAPVHPNFVNLKSRNGLGWLDGFSELICRCGLSFNGPPCIDEGARSPIESDLTLHGRIANIPAHLIKIGFNQDLKHIWVAGKCRESTLFGPHLVMTSVVTLPLTGTAFRVEDAIVNRSSAPTELQLLYHINIGAPFLKEGSQFETAFREMSPRDQRAAEGVDSYATYLGPTPGYSEQVYFFDTLPDDGDQARVLLRDPGSNLGVSVSYDRSQLPCLSQWKCTQPAEDGYVTGIEPGTNFPNFKSFERDQGRVISLESGQQYRAGLTLELHSGQDSVRQISQSIAARQSGVEPLIHSAPTQPFAAS